MVDATKGEPTKQQKYKYESREEALAAKKRRSNRARRERRRCAVERLMAANEDIKSPTMSKRGWTEDLEEFCSSQVQS